MKCKIFHARNREALQEAVNKWLENDVWIEKVQFSQLLIFEEGGYIVDNTLVLFYIPRVDEEPTK